jgi:hypothetical protein
MKVFVVSVNGEVVCRSGAGTEGNIRVSLSWPPPESPRLSLGGMDSVADEYLRWAAPAVNVGDEVVVQAIEAEACDPPRRVKRGTPNQLDQEDLPTDTQQMEQGDCVPAEADELGMVGYILSLNDKVFCRPGIGVEGVISVDFVWDRAGDLWLGVAGFDPIPDEHLRWDIPEIHVGDKITVKIIRTDVCDQPVERKTTEQFSQERWSPDS